MSIKNTHACETCAYEGAPLTAIRCATCDEFGSNYESADSSEKRMDAIGSNGNDGLAYAATPDLSADGLLKDAAVIMEQRGEQYDQAGGERSMARTVDAFNAITGNDLTEADGWLFMDTLKSVRMFSNRHTAHADSVQDKIAYSALLGESVMAGGLLQ